MHFFKEEKIFFCPAVARNILLNTGLKLSLKQASYTKEVRRLFWKLVVFCKARKIMLGEYKSKPNLGTLGHPERSLSLFTNSRMS